MYVLVSPFSKSFDDIWLTYSIPINYVKSIEIWLVVEISLKDKVDNWVIIKILEDSEIDFDKSKIKNINNIVLWVPILSHAQIKLACFISSYYFSHINNSVNLFLPKKVREKILKNKLNLDQSNKYNEIKLEKEIILNEKQEAIYNEIIKSEKNKILLFGITWSWKTEIYIKLIEKIILEWKQALLLIPEIILASQISERIESAFPWNTIIINSLVPEWKKAKHWENIYTNNSRIIIWTRSSLFYPYNNLWIIIIDEEHDNSYNSDKTPRYNSIEVAEKLSEYTDAKLLLWSWTPSVKSMYKAVKGEYKLISLLEKYK